MQLKNISLIAIFLFGTSVSTVASCSQTGRTELRWTQVSEDEVIIDVTLSSGIEIKGIRYRNDELAKKWLLQIKGTSGTTIQSNSQHLDNLSQKDFEDLFVELISSIKNNNDGQLDRVQIGLGFINELWEETASFLRKGEVPSSYKLKAKDLNLAKKISSNLETSSALEVLCDEVMKIQKVCKNNFVSMNPVTFESDYIGKEWSRVEVLPNIGIPTGKLWFGLSLSNIGNGEE